MIFFNILHRRFTNIYSIRKEQAEIVMFWHKALAAPSIVKLEKQPLLEIGTHKIKDYI